MPKTKFEEVKDQSQFKFWGILISRFLWRYSHSVVAAKFDSSDAYTTQVMNKFEVDGGYMDHRQFNNAKHLKTERKVRKIVINSIVNKPNITSPQILNKATHKGYDVSERTIRNLRAELGFAKIKPNALPQLSENTR